MYFTCFFFEKEKAHVMPEKKDNSFNVLPHTSLAGWKLDLSIVYKICTTTP